MTATLTYQGRTIKIPVPEEYSGQITFELAFLRGALLWRRFASYTAAQCADCGSRHLVDVTVTPGTGPEPLVFPWEHPPGPPAGEKPRAKERAL